MYPVSMTDELLKTVRDKKIYMVGIKGTGMAALAELLKRQGADITGSDVPEKFYTDTLLEKAGITYYEEFNPSNLKEADLVIHSSAYSPEKNPELIEARERGIPVREYTKALGFLSGLSFSAAIAGVHGKTTTTALTGTIIKELGLPASVLVGSAVPTFDDSAVYVKGSDYFIAETCEYKRHFLSFSPSVLLITSVEPDHQDYFKDYEDILSAFTAFGEKLTSGGTLIYCADDRGAADAAERIKQLREDIQLIPYGTEAEGEFNIEHISSEGGENHFYLQGFDKPFVLRVPGHHTILDAAGGLAVALTLVRHYGMDEDEMTEALYRGVNAFSGSKRRSEIIGEEKGILILDDYGHHPTAVETTLQGLKEFYPERRLVVDFMSHTYTRTEALLTEFSQCFSAADVVVLNKIYSSAREQYSGQVSSELLYEKTKENHREVYYKGELDEAVEFLKGFLKEGDLFVTMGAGNNWETGLEILHYLKDKQ